MLLELVQSKIICEIINSGKNCGNLGLELAQVPGEGITGASTSLFNGLTTQVSWR
jgi:hypothetical protein